MHKNKVDILSTAVLDDELLQMAAAAGINIDVVPFIEVQPIKSDELDEQIAEIGRTNACVVITSGNTPLPEKGGENWKIYCVGDVTKKALEKRFGAAAIAGCADNANDLADVILRDASIKELVFLCGDIHRDELPLKLKENNVAVTEMVVYKTIGLPQHVSKVYDGILFFSPSALTGFCIMNKIPPNAVIFAIGNTTANAVKAIAKNEIVIAAKPGKKILVETMISHYEQVIK